MNRLWSALLIFFLVLTGMAFLAVGHLLVSAATPSAAAGSPQVATEAPQPSVAPPRAGFDEALANPFEDTWVVLPDSGTWVMQVGGTGTAGPVLALRQPQS